MGIVIDKLSGNPMLVEIKEADLTTALQAKVNQGKVAGIITTTLPSSNIVSDKVYEFAGANGGTVTGGTIKDTDGSTITTLQNGDSLWYSPTTTFWYRIPFQSLANYYTIDQINAELNIIQLNPESRYLDSFSNKIGSDYYSETTNYFNNTNKIPERLYIKSIGSQPVIVAIFTKVGTVSTKISEVELTGFTAGSIVSYNILDLFPSITILDDTDYYVFLKNKNGTTNGTVGYISTGGNCIYITTANQSLVGSAPFKIGFWISTNKSKFLTSDEKKYLFKNAALSKFDLAYEIANKDEIYIPQGTHIITKEINIPSNKKIIGVDGNSILQADDGLANIFTISAKSNIEISGVTFKGNYANISFDWTGVTDTTISNVSDAIAKIGIGTDSAIKITGNSKNINIKNCTIKNFTNAGIELNLIGNTYGNGFSINNNTFTFNYIGILLQNQAEYSNIGNNKFVTNQIAIYCDTGNILFSENIIQQCRVGVVLNNGLNNSHGTFNGLICNHIKLYGLICNELENGEIFNACQFWYSNIYLKGSKGLLFSNNLFGNNSNIYADGKFGTSGLTAILSNMFYPNVIIYEDYNGNESNLQLKNNFFIDGRSNAAINN